MVLMLSLIHGVRAEWRAVIKVVPVALWSSWFPLMVRLVWCCDVPLDPYTCPLPRLFEFLDSLLV